MPVIRKLDQANWDNWVSTRPPKVQELCKQFPPHKLYLLKSTNHLVVIDSYAEDGTLMVAVLLKWNPDLRGGQRKVFGIKPEDLEECDIPPGTGPSFNLSKN